MDSKKSRIQSLPKGSPMVMISTKYTLQELENAVKNEDWEMATVIFTDHLFSWFLAPVHKLGQHCGYIKAALGFIWIEGLGTYYLPPEEIPLKKKGQHKSKALFIKMAEIIFNTPTEDKGYWYRIYNLGRSALTHSMMIQKDLPITTAFPTSFTVVRKGADSNHPDPIFLNPDALIIRIGNFVDRWMKDIQEKKQPEFDRFKSLMQRMYKNPTTLSIDNVNSILRQF